LIAGIAILACIALLAAIQAREGIALAALVGVELLAQNVLRRDREPLSAPGDIMQRALSR
jgi:hypothetical protein